MATEAQIEAAVDSVIRKHRTTEILYYPYVTGALDLYKQRVRTYGAAVSLVGRAIIRPTKENLTVIGNDEAYDIAFLFSRTEMLAKFSLVPEGEWLDVSGEMSWFGRRFRIEKVHPSGQIGQRFMLVIVLASTIEGHRDS